MAVLERHPVEMTEAAFMALPEDGYKHEWVNGKVTNVATGGRHSDVAVTLLELLIAAGGKKRGRVYVDAGFRMVSGNYRVPDAAFMRWERLPGGRSPVGFVQGAADLCFEVISPSEHPDEMHEKVQDYFESGAQQVWQMFPDTQSVTIYHSPTDARNYGLDDVVEAGGILPAFRHRVADLFDLA